MSEMRFSEIITTPRGAGASPPPDAALIGRAAEQAGLRAMLAGDVEHATVIIGEAGVGKTVLIDQLCRHARAEGWRVTRAIGVPAEQQIALSGLHQILFGLQEFTAELSPPTRALLAPVYGGEPGAAVASFTLVAAVLDLLAAAAASAPVLLAVDDMHWFDEVSAQVLNSVGRRLSHPRIRMAAGLRMSEMPKFSAAGWRELSLHPLGASDSELLLDRTEIALTDSARARILMAAAGNPLALTELPQCAEQIDAESLALPLTERLVSVFTGRLEQLEPSVRATMLRAALDGSTDGRQSRYEMTNVASAVTAGLLTTDPLGRAVFRHPLVRSAIIHQAHQSEIREAHGELATLYSDRLLRQASHLAAATDGPDHEVSELLVRAAELSNRRGGLKVAIRWLRRAAELNPDPQRRDSLFADAVFVAARAGRLDDTQDLLEDGAGGSRGSASALMAEAYREFHTNGDARAAHRWLLDGLSLADSLDDLTVSRLAHLLVSVTNYAGDSWVREKSNAVLTRLEGRFHPAILMYRTGLEDIGATAARVRTELLETHAETLPQLPVRKVILFSFPAYSVDAMAEFRAPLRKSYASLREHGASIDAIEAGRVVMLDLMATGDWQEAERIGRDCLAMSESNEGSALRNRQILADLGLLAAGQGDLDIARRYAATVKSWAAPRRLQRLIDAADRIEVRVAMADGDYGSAYRTALRLNPAGQTPRSHIRDCVDDLFDLVEAAVRAGEHDEARQAVQTAERLRLATISPRTEALWLAMTAMTASDSAAADLYQSAVSHPGLAESPFQLARTALAYSSWLKLQQRGTEALATLDTALEICDRLGAQPWSRQVRFEVRAAGNRAPSRRGESSAALTARERLIAELAAGGKSTRDIAAELSISARTVEAHLYRVFRKLLISRRSELGPALRIPAERYSSVPLDAQR